MRHNGVGTLKRAMHQIGTLLFYCWEQTLDKAALSSILILAIVFLPETYFVFPPSTLVDR